MEGQVPTHSHPVGPGFLAVWGQPCSAEGPGQSWEPAGRAGAGAALAGVWLPPSQDRPGPGRCGQSLSGIPVFRIRGLRLPPRKPSHLRKVLGTPADRERNRNDTATKQTEKPRCGPGLEHSRTGGATALPPPPCRLSSGEGRRQHCPSPGCRDPPSLGSPLAVAEGRGCRREGARPGLPRGVPSAWF